MAKSAEIHARRDLIADIFREEDGSDQKVEDVLDVLWEHPNMRTFWEGFKARKESRKEPQLKPQSESGPKPTGKGKSKKSIMKGDLNVTSAIRLVQRDLEVLEEQGLVEAVVMKEGRRVVVTAGDRRSRVSGSQVAGAAQPLLWRAGANLTNEVDMEGVAASVALDAICGKMAWLVPESLMEELIDARDRAKRRVAKLKTSSPQRRWLAALKLETTSPAFERPMFDEDVRQTIEQAIMQGKQVRLRIDDRSIVASVTGFIVKLPDRPFVEIWDHEVGQLWPDGSPWCSRFKLETIQQAELLATDAKKWAEPLNADFAAPKRRNKNVVYEFRARTSQMKKWAGTWLLDQLELIGEDVDGWRICRYVDTGEASGVRRYLSSLGAAVEVLKPLNFRVALAQHFEAAAAMYRDMQDMPVELEQARLDEEMLAAWGGIPRIVRPDWVPFTEDDHERLQRSHAWRKEPGVVESLCRLFCAEDPAGLYSPANPHSATEYLREVEELFVLLPTIQSERAMAEVIRTIFHRAFASENPADEIVGYDDWKGLASIAWLEMTGFRVKLRATAGQ